MVMRHDKTCKQCGAQCLAWGHTDSGFRLFEPNGELHVCQTAPRPCKHCGTEGLVWKSIGGKYTLVDGKTGYMHHCPDRVNPFASWPVKAAAERTEPVVVVKKHKTTQCGRCGKDGLRRRIVNMRLALTEACGEILHECEGSLF